MSRTFALILLVLIVFCAPLHAREHHPADARWRDLDGVSVPVPPAGHPRLFLRARNLDALRRRIGHPVLEPVWRGLLEERERNTQHRVMVDALRYLLEPDRELGLRTIADALDTIRVSTWQDPHANDQSRPIGRMMVTGAVVYDWCYGLLTEEQKREFVEQFIRLAGMLEIGYPPGRMGVLTGHGAEWMLQRDMLSAGVAIYDEYPDMYNHAARKFFAEFVPARNFWYPGHAFHQGTSYAETRFSSDLYPLWIFERMGAGPVYHPSQQFVPYNWIYMRRPDGRLLVSGDGEGKEPKLRSLLCASYYGDGYVLSDYLKNPGVWQMDKLYELLWRDPDLEPRPISELPLARYFGFPYGWMVARTGWGPESVICEMKVNIYNFINHQHQDAGAFQVYYKGPLAVDSGIYHGTGGGYISEHNVNYYKRTIAHNSLLVHDPGEVFDTRGFRQIEKVNDGGQRLPHRWAEAENLDELLAGDFRTGEVLGHWTGPDWLEPELSFLEGDITAAYSDKVRQVRRSFAFLNLRDSPVPAALIVFDRVVSADPSFRKYWLLHSMEEPEINGNSITVSLSQRGWTGRMVNSVLLPEPGDLVVEKVGGPDNKYDVFGVNFPSEPRPGRDPEHYETGEWRAQVSPSTAREEDLFLNVMEIMETGAESPNRIRRIEGEGLTGAELAGRAVLFNTGRAPRDRRCSFRLEGPEARRVLVTGLAFGAWQVRKDGRVIIPAVEVNEGEGILLFEGGGGEYELLR